MSWVEARQRRALAHFRRPQEAGHDRGAETLIKKLEELARVLERLQDPELRPGIARELRRHVAILEREIAELADDPRKPRY